MFLIFKIILWCTNISLKRMRFTWSSYRQMWSEIHIVEMQSTIAQDTVEIAKYWCDGAKIPYLEKKLGDKKHQVGIHEIWFSQFSSRGTESKISSKRPIRLEYWLWRPPKVMKRKLFPLKLIRNFWLGKNDPPIHDIYLIMCNLFVAMTLIVQQFKCYSFWR